MESINTLSSLIGLSPAVIALVIIWFITWKGLALWRAAQLGQKKWFIALLIVNTLGLLEIIYIFILTRKYKVEVVQEK
jgi:methionyl-tRNA synthetase